MNSPIINIKEQAIKVNSIYPIGIFFTIKYFDNPVVKMMICKIIIQKFHMFNFGLLNMSLFSTDFFRFLQENENNISCRIK